MNHDQNFKNLILDYPRQALEFFAAEEKYLFDGNVRITPIRQEQLKHQLKNVHYCMIFRRLLAGSLNR